MATGFLVFVVALLFTNSLTFSLIVGGIAWVFSLSKTSRRW